MTALQSAQLDAAREEYSAYFDALETHPRQLVGQQVPALDGSDGTEMLRDTNDAREWQDAVKELLVKEVNSRVSTEMDRQKTHLDTVHASIKMFQDNLDLVPNTPGFNKELADRVAKMVAPYEYRVDNKLHGYTIPIQPLIDSVRQQLAASTPATPAAPAAPATPAAAPQAGIPSRAGNSGASDPNDFSTLFSTLGQLRV